MCGIVCAFDLKEKAALLRPQILEMSKKIRHRGPDWSGVFQNEKVVFEGIQKLKDGMIIKETEVIPTPKFN